MAVTFGDVLSGIGEWWYEAAQKDHAVGINLADPEYRRAAFEEMARIIYARIARLDDRSG